MGRRTAGSREQRVTRNWARPLQGGSWQLSQSKEYPGGASVPLQGPNAGRSRGVSRCLLAAFSATCCCVKSERTDDALVWRSVWVFCCSGRRCLTGSDASRIFGWCDRGGSNGSLNRLWRAFTGLPACCVDGRGTRHTAARAAPQALRTIVLLLTFSGCVPSKQNLCYTGGSSEPRPTHNERKHRIEIWAPLTACCALIHPCRSRLHTHTHKAQAGMWDPK